MDTKQRHEKKSKAVGKLQNMKIKWFIGTSENAVKIQTIIA